MSCINKRGTRKTAHVERHRRSSSRVQAIHKTTYKLQGREFSSQSYTSARYAEKTWIRGKPANLSRYEPLVAIQRRPFFLAIDPGVSLTINASIGEVRDMSLLIHERLRRAPSLSSFA